MATKVTKSKTDTALVPKKPRAKKKLTVDKAVVVPAVPVQKVASKASKSTTVVSEVTVPSGRYLYAVGRRKTAVAQVRLYPVSTAVAVDSVANKRPLLEYFGTQALVATALLPLQVTGLLDTFSVSVVVRGGGLHGQADAIKLGVARCLIKHDVLLRAPLKALGLLTRDARVVERKKPGLKKARRSPQWAKR